LHGGKAIGAVTRQRFTNTSVASICLRRGLSMQPGLMPEEIKIVEEAHSKDSRQL